ncbi:MAG: type III secretion system cytoplasmic ring protein SctQ [Alphaproteobacteria bacterium]|nr:type III secretion system cytoplasmic ring protein SctQ [Alphaproteobacteria bacterium]
MMDRPHSLLDHDALDAFAGRPETVDISAYDPPALAPALLALNNRLGQRRPPVTAALGDAVVAFAPIGLGSIDVGATRTERVIFRLGIDGRPAALHMAKGLHERMLARIDPELLAAEIDDDILPLLLESCIEDGLTMAEAGLQSRIELLAVEVGTAVDLDGLDVMFQVFIDGEKAGLASLRAARQDVERLAQLFAARSKPERSYGDLEVALSFRAGAVWLDLAALRSLKTGDVLLVEEDASRWERMAAIAGEHWLFPIEVTRTGPTVRAPFRRADSRDQEEWMMVEHNRSDDEEALTGLFKSAPRPGPDRVERSPDREAAAAGAGERSDESADIDAGGATPPADAAFDDLPIKLVFELGRLDLPLGELQEIGPGHVFALDRPLGEAVEIHAGGRRIGQGEIMRIEDQIGVRVVRLFGQSGA